MPLQVCGQLRVLRVPSRQVMSVCECVEYRSDIWRRMPNRVRRVMVMGMLVSCLECRLFRATREGKHGHEQIANKFFYLIENKSNIYSCQHAKPFKTRHFNQSQATMKITIDAGIYCQAERESNASNQSKRQRSFPWSVNEGKTRAETSKAKERMASKTHSTSQVKTLTREAIPLHCVITINMPVRTSRYGAMAY